MSIKLKLNRYRTLSRGGGEIAPENQPEKILSVDVACDSLFRPCPLATKIDRKISHLMREELQLPFAFGFCAHEGCLSLPRQLNSGNEIFTVVLLGNPSIPNPKGILPRGL
jgi:hypothetical protein